MYDEIGAWNGALWQNLNRRGGHRLYHMKIARVRHEAHELRSSDSMIYEDAFRFLVAPTWRQGVTPFDDGYQWAITLDKLRDPARWKAAFARIQGKIDVVDRDGVPRWNFVFDGGYGRGDRKTQMFHRVWLPMDSPSFPVRLETRSPRKDNPWIEFRVIEFSKPQELEGGVKIRYPLKYRKTWFNAPRRNKNLPYSIKEVEIREAKFNHSLTEEDFLIDQAGAHAVTDLDTGKTFRIGK